MMCGAGRKWSVTKCVTDQNIYKKRKNIYIFKEGGLADAGNKVDIAYHKAESCQDQSCRLLLFVIQLGRSAELLCDSNQSVSQLESKRGSNMTIPSSIK